MLKLVVRFVRLSVIGSFVAGSLLSQEKSSARDMYFGGIEAAAASTKKQQSTKQNTTPSSRPATATPQSTAIRPSAGRPNVPILNAVSLPLGVRCSILKGKGKDAVEVPASTRFRSGDEIELRVQPNQDGFLYIITQGSSGTWRGIYPKPGTQGLNRIKANQEHVSYFHFDKKPGVEKLFIVVSRTPN